MRAAKSVIGVTVLVTVVSTVGALAGVASASPSPVALTVRNVPACQTPQSAAVAQCHAIRHELVDSHGRPVAPSTTTPAGYYPADLQSAYGLADAAASNGSGRTIALVDAYDDPSALTDLQTYRSVMGLKGITSCTLPFPSATSSASTTPCFAKVDQQGSTTSAPSADSGWAQEISVDLDMASATCPNCNILLVEADSSSMTDLGAAVNEAAQLGAAAISNSYGSRGDLPDSTYGTYYDHAGIAVTASTGDNGYGVGYPATSAFTIAVGGTSLKGSSASGWSETAWSGAGSGCSTYQSKPSWQTVYTGCSQRAIADVSAVADPNTGVAVYDTYSESGWLVFGGTSVASPIIAAVYALAGPSVNYPAELPYEHSGALNDVQSGSNGRCRVKVLCTSGVGWDGPTGLGTPQGLVAFGGAAPATVTPGAPTGLSASVSGSSVSLSWSVPSDPGSGIDDYTIFRGSIQIGTSTTTGYTDPSLPAGTYTYTVQACNSAGCSASSNTASATIPPPSSGTAPTITGVNCSGGAMCLFTGAGTGTLSWSFAGGSPASATGSSASTTYGAPGTYTVTLSGDTAPAAQTSVTCSWAKHGKNKQLSCG